MHSKLIGTAFLLDIDEAEVFLDEYIASLKYITARVVVPVVGKETG